VHADPAREKNIMLISNGKPYKKSRKTLEDTMLLNTMLFLHLQRDQHKADAPIHILALNFLSVPFNQFSSIFIILVGQEIL
jgi:hypothetical protein